MELRHLRYFVAVVDHLNITRAAAALHLSQPALSRQIRDLELEIGAVLFLRQNQQALLTPAGQAFLPLARQTLSTAEQAIDAARDSGRLLRLGHYGPLWLDHFSKALRLFQKQNPSLRLEPVELAPADIPRALHLGQIDFAFLGSANEAPPSGLEHRKVAEVPALLALSAANPLAKRRRIPLRELAAESWIGWSKTDFPGRNVPLENACLQTGFRPHWHGFSDSVGSLLMQLPDTPALAVVLPMTRKLPHPGVVFSQLQGDPVRFSMEVAWLAQHPRAQKMKALAQMLARASV